MNKNVALWLGAMLCAVFISGCAALVVGAAAGGATVSYVNNELRATESASLERVWKATLRAVQDAGYVRVSERQDARQAVWKGENAAGQQVVVNLQRVADDRTTVRIRVGVVSTAQNREAAMDLYDRIRARL
ncbi:MAG: DUF3568 domain-containing protein [Verrucomicrobiae bacterium]|nr:DUF3568 domain-containing protein [Verrucomicrobiae bacterium]MDW8344645.1 DUF3568 family protein [Verrucomicrobiae bacterium]